MGTLTIITWYWSEPTEHTGRFTAHWAPSGLATVERFANDVLQAPERSFHSIWQCRDNPAHLLIFRECGGLRLRSIGLPFVFDRANLPDGSSLPRCPDAELPVVSASVCRKAPGEQYQQTRCRPSSASMASEIMNRKFLGSSAARNKGVELASGEVVNSSSWMSAAAATLPR